MAFKLERGDGHHSRDRLFYFCVVSQGSGKGVEMHLRNPFRFGWTEKRSKVADPYLPVSQFERLSGSSRGLDTTDETAYRRTGIPSTG
jgi:hypothetical protein